MKFSAHSVLHCRSPEWEPVVQWDVAGLSMTQAIGWDAPLSYVTRDPGRGEGQLYGTL